MARKNDIGPGNPIDDQIDRLAGQLRDEGVAPQRDLWQGIDQAISATEQRQIGPRPVRRWDWPQIAAIAAVLVVLVSAGWVSLQRGGPMDLLAEAPGQVAEMVAADQSGLDVINQALFELNQALAKDPDNRSLANLALMLHQSRGKALRQDTEIRLKQI